MSRRALLTTLAHDQSERISLLDNRIRANDPECDDKYEINLPGRLKRSKFIITDSAPQEVHDRTRQALQSALAKALDWNEQLISGEVTSMASLAKREGITQRYVSHLLKLAYLVPDIMSAIAKGQIPYDLTLTHLKKGVPLNWAEQRKMLGFSR